MHCPWPRCWNRPFHKWGFPQIWIYHEPSYCPLVNVTVTKDYGHIMIYPSFVMGKLAISTGPFSIAMLKYQMVNWMTWGLPLFQETSNYRYRCRSSKPIYWIISAGEYGSLRMGREYLCCHVQVSWNRGSPGVSILYNRFLHDIHPISSYWASLWRNTNALMIWFNLVAYAFHEVSTHGGVCFTKTQYGCGTCLESFLSTKKNKSILILLVVYLPLWKILVTWDDCSK